jgi:hypothetical protein
VVFESVDGKWYYDPGFKKEKPTVSGTDAETDSSKLRNPNSLGWFRG